MEYKIEVLRQAVTDAFCAEGQYREHIRNKWEKIADPKICGGHEVWERWCYAMDAENRARWQDLAAMCRLIGVDQGAVIAVEKSIRRNMQYQHNWEHEAHLSGSSRWHRNEPGSEDSYRRVVADRDDDAMYYQSTGRRRKW